MCKSVSKKTPQKYFKETLLNSYRDKLIKKDDSFMSENAFDKTVFPLPIQLVFQEINGFYNIWTEVDEHNKNIIWQHIHALITASDKCDGI